MASSIETDLQHLAARSSTASRSNALPGRKVDFFLKLATESRFIGRIGMCAVLQVATNSLALVPPN